MVLLKKHLILFLLAIIISATFISYSNSFRNEFVWDDRHFIVENSFVHDFSHWRDLFTHNMGYAGGSRNNFYRPLFSLLNTFDYVAGKGKPFMFHLTNTFLHAGCAILVFTLIYLIAGKNHLVAFGTAILFALHPVATQSVTYISGRADPLYLFFSLSSMIFFIIFLNGKKKAPAYLLSLFCLIFSFLAKEAAIVTPFLILLYINILRAPKDRKTGNLGLIPHFMILFIYALLRITILNFSKESYTTLSLQIQPLMIRAITACKAIFMYFRFLLVPTGFHMETHLPYSTSLAEREALFAIVGVMFIIGIMFYQWKRNKYYFFGLTWFFVALFPVLNIIPVNAVVAIHWLYLPSIGFFFLLNCITRDLLGEKNKYIYVSTILFISLSLGILTYRSNERWKNEEALYKSILPFSRTPRVYVNLGNIYARGGELDKASFYYLKAMELAPGQTEVYVNLGYVYSEKGDFKKAEKMLKKAIDITPKHPNAHFNLAAIYANTGRPDEAITELKKTLSLDPYHYTALNVLGELYLEQGRKNEAWKAFKRSLKVKNDQPRIKEMLQNLESPE